MEILNGSVVEAQKAEKEFVPLEKQPKLPPSKGDMVRKAEKYDVAELLGTVFRQAQELFVENRFVPNQDLSCKGTYEGPRSLLQKVLLQCIYLIFQNLPRKGTLRLQLNQKQEVLQVRILADTEGAGLKKNAQNAVQLCLVVATNGCFALFFGKPPSRMYIRGRFWQPVALSTPVGASC